MSTNFIKFINIFLTFKTNYYFSINYSPTLPEFFDFLWKICYNSTVKIKEDLYMISIEKHEMTQEELEERRKELIYELRDIERQLLLKRMAAGRKYS